MFQRTLYLKQKFEREVYIKSMRWKTEFFAVIVSNTSQLTFTGSKSEIETLEKGVKYVQSFRIKYKNFKYKNPF